MPNDFNNDQGHFIDKDLYQKAIKSPTIFNSLELERAKSALKDAMDIRKFEIDLYWKRATYFWTFISVIYGAYFYIFGKISDITLKQAEFVINPKTLNSEYLNYLAQITESLYIYLTVVALLGMIFTLAWHWVNQGSKFWQENWEYQVDSLENLVHGPLYKTIIFDDDVSGVTSKRPFSVTKINISLSFIVFSVSLVCFIYTASIAVKKIYSYEASIWLLLMIVMLGVYFSFFFFPRFIESSVWKQYKKSQLENSSNKNYFLRPSR